MGGGAATGGGGSSLVSPIGSAKQRELPLLRPDCFAAATVSRALDSLDGVARSKRLHGGKREEEEDSDANLGESKTGPSPIPL